MRIIKPAKLKTGDVIGIIAPASSSVDPTKLENGIRYIEKNGYRVEVGKNISEINAIAFIHMLAKIKGRFKYQMQFF